jgi:uncharacterized protein
MKQLSEILTILKNEKRRLHEKYHVAEIAVFGSVSRGEATEASDIDLLVELDQPLGLSFITLADELESLLQTKVDIADKEMLHKLWPYISSDLVYA